MHRCHKNNHVAMLRGQPVVGGGRAVAYVIRSCDMASESQEIAVAQSVWPLFRWDEEIFPPARPLEPAFAAKRLDHMVSDFGAAAQKLDNLLPRCLPPAPLVEREDDPTFLL